MTNKATQDHHYFASNAMYWVRGNTQEEAHEKLIKQTDKKWIDNCLKSGEPLVFFSCRVPLPFDGKYAIEWYCPQVEGLTECGNHLILHKSAKKIATMPDPRDTIKTLRHELRELKSELVDTCHELAGYYEAEDAAVARAEANAGA